MFKTFFMLDKISGRIVMVRSKSDTVSFSFMPDFRSERLARVTLNGVTDARQAAAVLQWRSADIIRAGIHKYLGDAAAVSHHVKRVQSVVDGITVTVEA